MAEAVEASASLRAARRQAKTEGHVPKMKSKRGAAKRFTVRPGGTIKRGGAYKRHILTKKTTKRKRAMRKRSEVDSTNLAAVRSMLPYSS
jgi:large subunit ribosomal protein L35